MMTGSCDNRDNGDNGSGDDGGGDDGDGNTDLIKKWLLAAAQKDGGNGDPTKLKSFLTFRTYALLSNDKLIHLLT